MPQRWSLDAFKGLQRHLPIVPEPVKHLGVIARLGIAEPGVQVPITSNVIHLEGKPHDAFGRELEHVSDTSVRGDQPMNGLNRFFGMRFHRFSETVPRYEISRSR